VTALLIVLTGLLVLFNAFFVIAEYALVRSRRVRLQEMAEEGSRGARMALRQLDAIGDYISACQVGITMASIAIGALGEPSIAHALEPIFGRRGHGIAVAVSVVVAYVLITFFQSTVGEIVPKLYTIQHAEGLARRIAPPMQTFIVVFRPFIVALNASSEWMLRRLGVDPDAEPAHGTPEELKRLIAESQTGGQLDVGEAEMLTGVFHLHEQEARQVMTPIPAVVTVDIAETVGAALRLAVATGHSRLVVTEDEDEDHVRGIVHVNQLVKLLIEGGDEHASFATMVREAPIFPETKPLDDLLADLQRERTEMGIVVDEYGRTAGIVTIEDIIEEVVGEIADETDPAGGAIRRLANGDWFVRGHVAITDLEDYGLDLPVDTDAYNSVGGFVFAELGRLPKRGDQIRANGYSIRVESVRQNRIEAVRIRERREPERREPERHES
jgi:CBS domain containing-hemolysin-like protein